MSCVVCTHHTGCFFPSAQTASLADEHGPRLAIVVICIAGQRAQRFQHPWHLLSACGEMSCRKAPTSLTKETATSTLSALGVCSSRKMTSSASASCATCAKEPQQDLESDVLTSPGVDAPHLPPHSTCAARAPYWPVTAVLESVLALLAFSTALLPTLCHVLTLPKTMPMTSLILSYACAQSRAQT